MMSATNVTVALLPLATIAYLMVGRYWPATRALPAARCLAIGLGDAAAGLTATCIATPTITAYRHAANSVHFL